MNICNPNNIKIINESECLSESLNTINSNFTNLSAIACSLKERIDAIRLSRTFFYYGPNSDIIAYNSEDGQLPSDFTISTFVNSPEELDLQSSSRPGDTVYIVYQKTGHTPIFNQIPVFYNTTTSTTTTPTPVLVSSRLGGQYGADFLPGSFFMRYRRSIDVTATAGTDSSIIFKYKRVGNNGLILSAPIYTPVILTNQNSTTQTYRARWRVTDSGAANMPEGNYEFTFGIGPQESLNFKNRMQTWLETNIGRHNVNIEGNIEILVTRTVRLRPFSRINSRTSGGVPIQISTFTSDSTQTGDIDIEAQPIFCVWKLTYEKRPGRDPNRFIYYINNGWPRIFRAQTSGVNASNWNQPQTWTTYNSW
jgi:hypothetical protein